ncbi:BGTF surface domain-containing protein [Haladaptatus caseinilyticus]|uniref:BGTF surface domain-containing protein n=1 Tax=Haladaptatus caseinilyticus TaxID=2993314 RepID=UPI00224B5949|nr:BGTF surface domain-containing protein [Haladaptatus caseinilyticus]
MTSEKHAWVVAVLLCSLVVAPLASITVVDGKSAAFTDSTVSDDRGDVIEITVRTNEAATVNIGSKAEGFWVKANVTGGKTTLALNTYRADGNDSVTLVEGGLRGKVDTLVPSEAGPLQTGTYDMNVTIDGITQDVGSFTVEERETGSARTLVLPASTDLASFESPADLEKAASTTDANGTIASRDRFVFALDVSGLAGFIHDASLDGSDENVSIAFYESNSERNTVPNEFDGADVTEVEPERLRLDEETDTLYLVVDTAKHGMEVGDEYDVTFEIGADNSMVTDVETATTSFRVVERRVTLDYDGDVLIVADETTIGGKTTLAPGTTINVTAFDEGKKPFFWPATPVVTENRTFGATFDFGAVTSGTEFTIELRDQGKTTRGIVASTPVTIVQPTTTTTTTPTTTMTTTATTTATTTTTGTAPPTSISTDAPITAQTVSQGGLPGFDVTVALVALVAAGFLVVRRFR